MLHKFVSKINIITKNFTSLLLLIMVILVFIQIILRELSGTSFNWISDVAKYSMIWVVFLGSSFAFQHGAHVAVDILIDRVSVNVKKVLFILVLITSSIFLVVFFYTGLELVSSTFTQISPNLNIPMAYIYLVIPISGLLMLINLFDVIIHYLRTGNNIGEGGADV